MTWWRSHPSTHRTSADQVREATRKDPDSAIREPAAHPFRDTPKLPVENVEQQIREYLRLCPRHPAYNIGEALDVAVHPQIAVVQHTHRHTPRTKHDMRGVVMRKIVVCDTAFGFHALVADGAVESV